MMERSEKTIGQKERDDAILDFVNFQAQEAILNPNLSNDFKDLVVGDAIRKIQRIGERRATYEVQHDGKPHDIYKS
jgi:hypothetical protein